MPSEKHRYIDARRGPESPLNFNDLRERLLHFGSNQLADILWVRSQSDDVLRRILIGSVGLRLVPPDIQQARAAIDCAIHFPDFIRYFEKGHDQILEEIRNAAEVQAANGYRQFAVEIMEYALSKAEEVAENFEEDWDWTYSMQQLSECVNKLKSEMAFAVETPPGDQ